MRIHSVHLERTEVSMTSAVLLPPTPSTTGTRLRTNSDGLCQQFLLLVLGQRNALARGAHAHHIVHTAGDLMLDKLLQTCVIDAAVGRKGVTNATPRPRNRSSMELRIAAS
jgi:hypothetical protein